MRQTWTAGTTTFDCDLTSMRGFVETVTISHISGYNARTLVNNLQMGYLTCQEPGTLQTKLPLWLGILSFSYHNPKSRIESAYM